MRRIMFSILLSLWLAGASSPAKAEWLRAETEHFIVYGDMSEGALRNHARKIERFDGLLRAYYPIPIDHEIPKLEIFLADGLRDMRQIVPGLGSNIGGFYSPNSSRIHAVVNIDSDMGDHVLFHEYAHHFMFQMAAAAYPSWFVEGFAEYYSTVELRENRIQIGMFNAGRMNSLTLAPNSWVPLEDVLSWRISATGRYRGADYYALSWALVHYMYSDPARTQALGRYLNAVSQGADSVQAMQAATGRTARQLQDDIRSYMGGAIPVLTPALTVEAGEIVITRLPESVRDLMWLDLRLDRLEDIDLSKIEDAEDRQKASENLAGAIADATRLAERWPGDRLATLVLARAQRLGGDRAAALATLEPLLAAELDDAIALRLGAMMLMEQAAADTANGPDLTRRARGYLVRAMNADPLDFRVYLALDDSRQGMPGYPTANDQSTLEVAVALAPQSFDARLRYATVLMARGLPGDAVIMLASAANSPHDSPLRTAARALLVKAREQAGLAPAAQGEPPPEEPAPETDAAG